MSSRLKVGVGGTALDDGAAFISAWNRAQRGEDVQGRVVTFESWEGLSSVMSAERLALLRHLHSTPEASPETVARALGRDPSQIASDLDALEETGLVERSGTMLRVTADSIEAEILL